MVGNTELKIVGDHDETHPSNKSIIKHWLDLWMLKKCIYRHTQERAAMLKIETALMMVGRLEILNEITFCRLLKVFNTIDRKVLVQLSLLSSGQQTIPSRLERRKS